MNCTAKSEEYSIWISPCVSSGSSELYSVFSGIFIAEEDEVGDGARRYHTRCCTDTFRGLVEHVPEVCLSVPLIKTFLVKAELQSWDYCPEVCDF